MLRVLIADDQRINRVLLARCLDSEKYEVLEASNGVEAVKKFEEFQPDVVLLDVMMPEMDGFEAARAIKSKVVDGYVPIIMVTSLSDEKSLSDGMEAGADDFIPKPFNRLVLESKLKAAIRTRQVFQSLNAQKKELEDLHEQGYNEQIMAERLMAALLKSSALKHPMFKYRSQPMDVFNGDLLMAGEGPNGRVRVLFGDFSGHGLAAAIGGLPMAMDFSQKCRTESSLFDLAKSANAKLRQVLPRDRFMAAALLDVDPSSNSIEIMNAGLPNLLVRGAQGGIARRIASSHLPLAVLEDVGRPEDVLGIRLAPGERLYLYSDGVTEARNPSGEDYGEQRFEAALAEERPADEVFDSVLAQLDTFVGEAPPEDDVTLMEIDPSAGHADQDQAIRFEFSPSVRMNLHFTPEIFRSGDVLILLEGVLESIGPLEGHRASVFAVLAELINNAMDHGVLGLDSAMKADIQGFAQYYEERERRLSTQDEGYVDVGFVLTKHVQKWRFQVEVEDSGQGFDVSRVQGSNDKSAHGRGLEMVRGICEFVQYHEPGNRVVATYTWEPTADLAA